MGCLAPPSRCLRDLFLLALSWGTVPLHGYGSGKMVVLSGEERALDGTPQESAAGTQSTWLKWPLWFKQSLALSPGNWTLSSSLSVLKWQFPLLAGNCLPYHQPCSYSLRPTSVLEPTCFYAQYDGECWSLLYKRFAARRRRQNTWRDHNNLSSLDAVVVLVIVLVSNSVVGWELSPLPSTLSYNPQPMYVL